MRCPNISGRVQSGLTSTGSCTVAREAKFSLIVTLDLTRHNKRAAVILKLVHKFIITNICLGIITGFSFALVVAGIPSGRVDMLDVTTQQVCKPDIASGHFAQQACTIPKFLTIVLTVTPYTGAVLITAKALSHHAIGAVVYGIGILVGLFITSAAI